ncbi:MAG: phytanoyl-CoA dioxygenase family protein, partial [Fibrella sp.]|nr:phytanoyl-CoA dioxygenase family protein [Armatimonadota bacterium]
MTTTADNLTADKIVSYRERGFVHIPGIITEEEAAHFYEAALAFSKQPRENVYGGSIFTQLVNVWQESDTLRTLTRHRNIAAVATKLAGVPLRLWHDQILIKQPHNNAATEFHQDQPYWPHANSTNPISAWVALCDVPVEKGCMTFLPGSQKRTELPAQNLGDDKSLFGIAPDFVWNERITVPLKAGDCTFHHGRCAHMATPNFTDDPRVAHIVIFMDADTTYTGAHHIVTDPLGL